MATPTGELANDPSADPIYQSLLRRRNFFGALAIAFGALFLLTILFDTLTTVREDRTFKVGPAPKLVVRDGIGGGLGGGVTVRAGGPEQLRVEGTSHARWRVHYTIEQHGDTVVVEAQAQPWLAWLGVYGPPRFVVTAPPATAIDVEARRGPIVVERMTGGGSVRSADSPIQLNSVGGRLQATTTNGAIEAAGFDGTAELHTVNGAVNVHDSRGVFDLSTVNGAIRLDAELRPPAQNKITTTNGRIAVRLRGEPDVRIDAGTTNGAVVARRAINPAQPKSNTLVGTIGNGEGELVVRTTNGEIVIE